MDRTQLLHDLIELRRPLDAIVADLRTFPFDSEQELATIEPGHIRAALGRFLDGQLTAQQVEDWANAIEGRDDIAFTPGTVDLIAELANPLLYQPLTTDTAHDTLQRINSQ